MRAVPALSVTSKRRSNGTRWPPSRGITASQVQLGKLLYSADEDGPRDRNMAADLLQKAAATGDREAKRALAMLYLQGEGVARDVSRAKELLKEAADAGHTGAALQLGHVYFGKHDVGAKEVKKSEGI